MDHKLQEICRVFQVEGTYIGYEEITVGHVNRTYKVTMEREGQRVDYVAQSLNTVAFRDPNAVMSNIEKITRHIRAKKPNDVALHFAQKADGMLYHVDGAANWRLFNYVPSDTYNDCADLEVVENAGCAFGEFQTLLSDFDPAQLYDTIPNFHDTRIRYIKFEDDLKKDPLGLVADVQEEVDWLLSQKETACSLMELFLAGRLPRRATHNDTKINNVLFEQGGKKALVVVDLDTVMPGLVGFDFGDAIRFAANKVAEDSRDYGHAGVDLDVFRAFARGFLSQTAGMLTPMEVETLPLSCFVMTLECGLRFLNDYIEGNVYFKIDYPDHNLVRARTQIWMAKDLLEKQGEMADIVKECLAELN